MHESQSTFKVLVLVMLAILCGGLLLAQEPKGGEAETQSPSVTTEQANADAVPTDESAPEPAEMTAAEASPSAASPTTQFTPAAHAKNNTHGNRRQGAIASLWIFVLAVFLGFVVITKVPPTLHTPLMSGSNAISGITLVGAVIVAATWNFSGFVGFLAVTLATINVVGGFLVTHRMLAMFKKR